MKKFLLFIFISISIFIFPGCIDQSQEIGQTINVYNWGEFISSGTDGGLDVNKEFTKKTGIKVNYTTYQNNEELFAKLSGGGAHYDVIFPSDYMISKLIENDMLTKLDFKNIPNFSLINPEFKNLNFDPLNEYSVPYMWGLIGIFYNKNRVTEKEVDINWDILWKEKYKKDILMFDNARDAFAISLLRLGYSINSTKPEQWKEAATELLKQRPLVQAYVMDQIFDKIGNSEAALASYYAGTASIIMENNKDIGFVIPKEGTNKFVDSMCIPKDSQHKKEAEMYINFICDTNVALANVKQTGYSTPHIGAFELLDEDVKQNKIFYPNNETINNAQTFINLPPEINKLMDELWIEVKSGETTTSPWMLVVILAGFAIIYLGVAFYKRPKNKK